MAALPDWLNMGSDTAKYLGTWVRPPTSGGSGGTPSLGQIADIAPGIGLSLLSQRALPVSACTAGLASPPPPPRPWARMGRKWVERVLIIPHYFLPH